VPNRKGYGKVGKRKAAFQLSHSHDYYEIPSVMGYGFKGQVQKLYSTKLDKLRTNESGASKKRCLKASSTGMEDSSLIY
jgi:hypothetical protein